jgi:SAM-dependent methyltransferase
MSSSLASRWTVFDRLIQAYRFRKVLALIPPKSTVVDFGCGNGVFLRSIKRRIGKAIGVDQLTPPSEHRITFVQADLEGAVPLPNGCADAVTALALFEHLSSPATFVAEAYRILKQGGVLILTTPSPAAKPVLEFLAFRVGIISKADVADHKKYYGKEELQLLFSAFDAVRISNFQFGLNTLVCAVK